jgi:hypothetical protein
LYAPNAAIVISLSTQNIVRSADCICITSAPIKEKKESETAEPEIQVTPGIANIAVDRRICIEKAFYVDGMKRTELSKNLRIHIIELYEQENGGIYESFQRQNIEITR